MPRWLRLCLAVLIVATYILMAAGRYILSLYLRLLTGTGWSGFGLMLVEFTGLCFLDDNLEGVLFFDN
jgi:hypothetical protein